MRAVTTPFSSTVAIVSSFEVNTTLLSVVSSGRTVAVTVPFSPTQRYSLSKESSTFSAIRITVTLHSARISPFSADFAVIVASPVLSAVTSPFTTVRISSSLEDHTTSLLYASAGRIVAVRVKISSTLTVFSVSLSSIPVTC